MKLKLGSKSTTSSIENISQDLPLDYKCSINEIEDNDELAWKGVDLFFQNEFDEGQEAFMSKGETDFLYALCYGATCLFQAGLTLQEEHINNAIDKLTHAHNLAQKTIDQIHQIEGNTMMGSISKAFGWFTPKTESSSSSSSERLQALPKISPLEFRAQIVKAESSLLIANMQLMQESWVCYMKAMLNLHQGFSVYHSLDKYIDAYTESGEKPPYDRHSLSGYYFGIGTINVIISMLPPKISALIGAITGKVDSTKGFAYVQKSIEMDGIRSALSQFQGSMMHILYISFCPKFSLPGNLIDLEVFLEPAIAKYATGFFFCLIQGRKYRALRNLNQSNHHYNSVLDSKGTWEELTNMANYELSFNHIFALEWDTARQLFEDLAIKEYWSPIIFTYLQGVCLYELGDFEGCKNYLSKLESMTSRKFGGKVIAVESFATEKAKYFLNNFPNSMILPGLETISLWNGLSSMSVENLEKCKIQAEKALQEVLKLPSNTRFEEETMCYYILGAIEAELNNYEVAKEHLMKIQQFKKQLKLNSYILPFSYYESACIEFSTKNYQDSKNWLGKVKDCSGYFFENRLSIRVHLSQLKLKSALAESSN